MRADLHRAVTIISAQMPSAEEIVLQTFAALDDRDLDRFAALLHPDAEDRFLLPPLGSFGDRALLTLFNARAPLRLRR